MLARVFAYGLFGCAAEFAFTVMARRPKWPSAWMLPIYGLAAFAFPEVRRAVRGRSRVARAATYALSMIVAEYAIGRTLRETIGAAPWTYDSAFAIDHVTRLDYLPLWALYGLALERLDDLLGVAPNVSA